MSQRGMILVLFAMVLFVLGCSPGAEQEAAESSGGEAVTSGVEGEETEADGPVVVFLGDSLTAGYGLDEEEAFPALVQVQLAKRGVAARVVNAGVSGDTTAGGLARLDWLLGQQPDVVVVALGANDGLRALPLEATEANLRRIVERSLASGARVLLVDMMIQPNYGRDYAQGFAEIFPRLAAELDVPLLPFLLDGVAAEPELNLADGIHPNARGQRRLAENVLPYVRELLPQTGRR